ncbi:glycosyltransferase family 4 protein [Rhodopseudomonas sp. RCAM05734]|uniref:glycosyltransferase family 4 protein n=1 Tax=Rhodopseudomonas sp. RCAM05734 TaxID=3457549 RepID=UPI0040441462
MLRIALYPHSMELGGSQLNAIQLAGALRDRGHQLTVVAEPGPLVAHVRALGLEHVGIPSHRRRPDFTVARMLSRLVREREIDVVHGHEWPPILEAFAGPGLSGCPVIGTVMSMSVAPFIPKKVPLTVGTELIRQSALAAGHKQVFLLEPPVDTSADSPFVDGHGFREQSGIQPSEILIAIICRLVPDLKLEGILSTCDAVGELCRAGKPVRLLIVGDGRARAEVDQRAANINSSVGRELIMLTGELSNPRPAYAAADVIVGQGGSALRGIAFAKPLLVVGENGFSELLTPESCATFLQQGWYGLGPGSLGGGPAAIRRALEGLVDSGQMRSELGEFGRNLAESRFSLRQAAKTLERAYAAAIEQRDHAGSRLSEAACCATALAAYKINRKYQKWLGTARVDDSNSRSRVAAVLNQVRGSRTP